VPLGASSVITTQATLLGLSSHFEALSSVQEAAGAVMGASSEVLSLLTRPQWTKGKAWVCRLPNLAKGQDQKVWVTVCKEPS
jgi:hypothetical protein